MDPNAGFSENADGVSGPEMTQMGRLEGTIKFDGESQVGRRQSGESRTAMMANAKRLN